MSVPGKRRCAEGSPVTGAMRGTHLLQPPSLTSLAHSSALPRQSLRL